ncbi:MAG: hypothetical protein ACYS8W_17290 [Planctomycetota bacterium]|jgi:hypothetical protein
MKFSLPLKLAILVIIIFSLTIAVCLLYKPLRLRWFESKLDAGNVETRRQAVEKLLSLGPRGKAIVENLVIGKDRAWVLEFFGGPDRISVAALGRLPERNEIWRSGNEVHLFYDKFVVYIHSNGVVGVDLCELKKETDAMTGDPALDK